MRFVGRTKRRKFRLASRRLTLLAPPWNSGSRNCTSSSSQKQTGQIANVPGEAHSRSHIRSTGKESASRPDLCVPIVEAFLWSEQCTMCDRHVVDPVEYRDELELATGTHSLFGSHRASVERDQRSVRSVSATSADGARR